MKTKIQLARKCLKDNGFPGYTVVRRNKKPTSKGNKYEWNMFKRFTLWASGRDKPLYYGKTSGSGAQATRTKDHRSVMVGDMMSLCPEADFLTQMLVFEFKDRLETDIFDLLKSHGSIFDWWKELKEKAKKAEKHSALVFHMHGTRNDYLILDLPFFNQLFFGWLNILCLNKYFIFENLIILDLEYFFSRVKPWEFAHCFIDDQCGKQVEKDYGCKSKRKLGKENSGNTIRTIRGRSRLGNRH